MKLFAGSMCPLEGADVTSEGKASMLSRVLASSTLAHSPLLLISSAVNATSSLHLESTFSCLSLTHSLSHSLTHSLPVLLLSSSPQWGELWDTSQPVLVTKSPANMMKIPFVHATFDSAGATRHVVVIKVVGDIGHCMLGLVLQTRSLAD